MVVQQINVVVNIRNRILPAVFAIVAMTASNATADNKTKKSNNDAVIIEQCDIDKALAASKWTIAKLNRPDSMLTEINFVSTEL